MRLDLKPSGKGASRVPFALRVVGDVAAALDKDGELFLRFRSGAFDAMGVVTLAGGSFSPARGKGTWIDPELNLLSVAATPKRKSFKMKATFPPNELPETAPDRRLHLLATLAALSALLVALGVFWLWR